SAEQLLNFFNFMQRALQAKLLLAYHDRSDGGLFTTLVEMCFAGRCGATITLDDLGDDAQSILFNEELGAVLQVDSSKLSELSALLEQFGLIECSYNIGTAHKNEDIIFK